MREDTVKKFWTNCEESWLSTAKTPASLKMDARPREMAGKAKVATTAANIEGMPTRIKVTSWVELGSDVEEREAAKVPERDDAMLSQTEPSSLFVLLSAVDEEESTTRGEERGAAGTCCAGRVLARGETNPDTAGTTAKRSTDTTAMRRLCADEAIVNLLLLQ